jgi:superfamily II DNA or RNA helicase
MICKTISDRLYCYQRNGITPLLKSLEKRRSALDASDAGTGKTFVNGAIAKHFYDLDERPTVVVCPRVVIPAWIETLNLLGVKKFKVVTYETLIRGNHGLVNMPKQGKNAFTARWNLRRRSTIIFDEIHKAKSKKSLSAQLVIGAYDDKRKHNVLALSATCASHPVEMFALGYILKLHNQKNFRDFCRAHGCEDVAFGGLAFDPESEKGIKSLLHLHKKIFNQRGHRISIDDLGDKFPKTKIMSETYDMGKNTKKIQRVYDDLQTAIYRLDEHTSNYKECVLSMILKARRETELLKSPAMVEMALDAYENKKSVAIFVNFTESLEFIKTHLEKKGHDVGVIRGGQTDKQRKNHVDNFRNDKIRFIICNIRAGGVGVSLHDTNGKYAREAIISPNYSMFEVKQALGRVHRAGGKTVSLQRIVFAANTIEDRVCVKVRSKIHSLNALNDGDLLAGINIPIETSNIAIAV